MNNDLISRRDIKDHIGELLLVYSGEELANAILNAIDNAPTVPLPDFKEGYKQAIIDGKTNFLRPQGEWIIHNDWHENCRYGCNQCGNLTNIPGNFCPNCGVKMKKEVKNNG